MMTSFAIIHIISLQYSSGKYISYSFEIESNTILMTVFLLIMNQKDFRLVHNQKENCHYDRYIYINIWKKIRFFFFSVCELSFLFVYDETILI